MNATDIRALGPDDLASANALIRASIKSWDMPERLYRLVVSTYEYNANDFLTMRLYAAVAPGGRFTGVLALEDYPGDEAGIQERVLSLHGIYVDPALQHQGLGTRLTDFALARAREAGYAGVLAKAHASATGFFRRAGFRELPVTDTSRDYPHRYWYSLTQGTDT